MLKVSQRQAYGLTDPHEMMAELSDEAFRKDLSAVPFWVNQDEKGEVVNISDYDRYRVRRGSRDTIKQMNGVETLELLLEKMGKYYNPAEEKRISDMLRARAVFRKGGGRRNTQDVSDAARKTLERMSGEFGVKAHVHETLDDKIAPNIQSELRKGGKAWYEPKDGTVHVFLPNAEGALDAAQSYVHEVVAHKGMEGMLGRERYRQLCERLGNALNGERSELVKKYEGSDTRTLGDEYIAAIAEKAIDTDGAVREPSLWDKIKATVRSFFRDTFNLDLTDADIKYMLWKSAERLRKESRGAFRTAEDVVTEQELNEDSLSMRRAEADYLRETEDIEERAKANGTYMKAPNGKPSNLNTRQWAQVRTTRFKNWFGDWEKPLRIEKLSKSKPAAIRGNEIKPGDDLKQYKTNAREHGKALRGSYTNKDTGRSFTLGKQGVLEVLNHDSLDAVQLQSVAAIPQIIENSIYIDSLPNEDASKNPDVRQYYYFVCGLKVGSTDYTVRAVIAERTNGEWYYDHKLTQIEKGKLLDSLSGITTPGFSQEASKDSAGKDRRLFSLLQANCSKIVDENGEPKVVYHQTGSRFNSFDINRARASADIQAFFFAPEYDKYHGYGRHTIEAFINLRNPAENPSGPDMSVSDGGVRAREKLEKSGYDGFLRTEDGVEEYAVFTPSQIKSATNNIGTFDEGDSDIRFRIGDPETRERKLARDAYESRVRNGMYQAREAVQDSMLSLKEAMKAVLGKQWKGVDEVEGFENPYQGENRLSSQNLAEVKAFERILFKPLLDTVVSLAKNEDERRELTDYMMAKHGLERNRVMAERNAKKDEDVAEIDRLRQSLEKRHDSGKLDDDDYADAIAKADSEYEKAYEAALAAAERDYAGLTALTGLEELAEAEAARIVEDYEDDHDTEGLWDRVNAVTKATLSKVYESGMLTKEAYQDINGMYEYYIPLRGFDEKTSAEAYAYLTHKNSAFNAPIKKAEGRTSKSDDPLAYMRSMATSAIVQGNRNVLVKQRLLNFALNHPSDLFSVSELWIAYDATKDEWTPVFPDNISEDDTPAEVEGKMADFEKTMQELASRNPDLYKRGRDAVGIPYRVVEKKELQQHQVIVKRGGRDVVVTVNGSPRVAQAVNGLTNPDNDIEGSIGAMLRAGEWVNRQLSALYTTRNPDFVISNFMRDALYSNSMAWIKESPNYALRFHRNFAVLNPLVMRKLFAKLREGKLDMGNEREAAFSAFIMNGGETDYTNMKDLDKIKREINGLYITTKHFADYFSTKCKLFFDL